MKHFIFGIITLLTLTGFILVRGASAHYHKCEECQPSPIVSPTVIPVTDTPEVTPVASEEASNQYGLPGDGMHTGGDGLHTAPDGLGCAAHECKAPGAPNTGFEPK